MDTLFFPLQTQIIIDLQLDYQRYFYAHFEDNNDLQDISQTFTDHHLNSLSLAFSLSLSHSLSLPPHFWSISML